MLNWFKKLFGGNGEEKTNEETEISQDYSHDNSLDSPEEEAQTGATSQDDDMSDLGEEVDLDDLDSNSNVEESQEESGDTSDEEAKL